MNYLMYLYFSHLPLVLEERRVIDGKEEVCLVIPTRPNQLKRGSQGNWMAMFRLAENEPNAKNQTHRVQLSYQTPEELQKSYDFGYHRRTAAMGSVYEHDRTPEKKLDRTNNARDIDLRGDICLSDIPQELIFSNAENAKKYISNLTFKGLYDDGFIYTGSICLSDIPKEDRWQDQNTGKRYVSARLIRLPQLDTYMNTHVLVIARPDTNDVVEIGKFKEWRKEGYAPTNEPLPYIPPSEPERRQPDSIQGIKF